tara:strand:- start:1275 stop:1601 length:327 start_codon:yes stop_codon:yes gene_type:complete
MAKYFGFFSRELSGKNISPWVYFYNYQDVIGKDTNIATFDQLLQINFSKTIKKRIKTCRIGTIIRIGYLSSSSEQILIRLDEGKVNKREQIEISIKDKKTILDGYMIR